MHVGHLRYLKAAARLGQLTVILNSDAWLKRKKGYAFLPWADRAELIQAYGFVQAVLPVDDEDGTCCKALDALRPDIFAKGGDRNESNTPEKSLCDHLGIRFVCGLGSKERSSSEIVERKWGNYSFLHVADDYRVKLLRVNPWQATSLQYHNERAEHWIFPKSGQYKHFGIGEIHKLTNDSDEMLEVVEVQTGNCSEEDIVRL